ncbi:MAG: hypothetical protein AB7W59_15205 [Acidimicrobiia bacterium]
MTIWQLLHCVDDLSGETWDHCDCNNDTSVRQCLFDVACHA